ncbi:MAG: M28 family peptidase [Bacteroidia bacterium]
MLRYLLTSGAICLGGSLLAQNSIPSITNLSISADTANHQVTANFDLADVDGDPMEVWIQVSADSGRTWRVAIDSLSGDHGFPITAGTGKSLTWHYQPSTLIPYGSGLVGYQLRVIADDRQTIDLQEIADGVDSARLHHDLLALEGVKHRTSALQKLEDTKDSLELFMDNHGLHPYRQGSAFGQYTCENVIGRRSGTRRDSATWMISGHFDTVNNAPGGDDNATAVACVSEAIRVLSNYQTKESLRFFYFDLEEAGLIGSYQYITSARPAWEDEKGLLNMDCVGYYSNDVNSQQMPTGFNILFPAAYNAVQADSFRGNFLTAVTNTASSWMDTVFTSTAAAHVPNLKVVSLVTPGTGLLTVDLRRSDHAPFWDVSIPAMFFSDGADFRNPNYHTPTDSVNKINLNFYVMNVRAIITTLARLAQLEHSRVASSGYFDIQVPVSNNPIVAKPQAKLQVLPTPTDGRVTFRTELPQSGNVRIEVWDHHGHLLVKAHEGWMNAGTNNLNWMCHLPAGQYAVALITENSRDYQPLVIVK